MYINKMGKFLRLFFGCHANPSRSFFWRGKQFPICARCTGELVGIILGIPIFIVWGYFSVLTCFFLMIPLIVDGTLQLKTKWVSNNMLRLFTGILFGIALFSIFVYVHIFTVKMAVIFLRTFVRESPYYDELIQKLLLKRIYVN